MQSPAVRINNITKLFGSFAAVDNVSIDIKQGEIFAFLGPNGAGKTTMVKMLTGLIRPTSGNAFIYGKSIIDDMDEIKRITGLIPEQPYVYPYLTAFEYMKLVADVYKIPVSEQENNINKLLNMFEIAGQSFDLIDSFSHGMKQKLVIASVLLHNPKIIFLDEPLVGLDPKSARIVKEILAKLSDNGVTVFMCTHVLEIAEKLAHRVCIINKGKIIAVDTIEALKQNLEQNTTLEDIYLQLTGGTQYRDLLKNF